MAYDIIGIGIGPFNLGLAALTQDIPELNCLFLDQNESFNWHPGLMIAGTTLQVPYYADLVTLANPESKFGYFNFLHAKKRMLRFSASEKTYITRKEYSEYCRWVVGQLPNLQFGEKVTGIYKANDSYTIITDKSHYLAKHIVIGVGTTPHLPSFAKAINHPLLFHSAEYLHKKETLLKQKRITLVGSGQSAAEIFYDLLQHYNGELFWFTRSDSFFPMDVSKFAIEKTSPDYINHFFSLADNIKEKVLNKQHHLYKGISNDLITGIYELLDEKEVTNIHLHPACELKNCSNNLETVFFHNELQESFTLKTDALILATGYKNLIPAFIAPVKDKIQWNNNQYAVNRNYSVDNCNTIFVQNADLHTHGFNAADLGLGPYRNATIVNTILQREHYEMETNTSFQQFGKPSV